MKRSLKQRGLWGVGSAVLAMGLLLIGTSAQAETVGQQKLLAKRAAQVDAYRKLTETIMGLQISSNTYVRDFVAESDEIRTGFDHFIKGLKVVGPPRYFDDGTCEVDVQVTLEQVMVALETLTRTGPWGDRYVIREMVKYNRKKIFTATGTGLPRDEPEMMTEAVPQELPARNPTAGIPGWENVTPRGRLMAERAAKVEAYRNLAETVMGLRISSNTYVRDFVAESDEIRTSLNTFLQGARQVGPPRYMPDGIVEVDVEVTIQDVIKHLHTLQQRWVTEGRYFRVTEFRNTTFETIIGYYPKKVIAGTGNGTVPQKYMLPGGRASIAVPAATPTWAGLVIQATGVGVPGEGQVGTEGRLMAERAAKVEAMRNLTEKVYGVQIDSRTTVRDFVTEDDTIQARVKQTLAGAEQVGEPRVLPDGSVEVTVQMPMEVIYVIYQEYRQM